MSKVEIAEALELFGIQDIMEVTGSGGGMNNITRIVHTQSGSFMLRIYETHQEAAKARLEHELLRLLPDMKLSFATPMPYQGVDGSSIVRLASGKLAAMYHYIIGQTAQLQTHDQLISFGKMVGELSNALATVSLDERDANLGFSPYYKLQFTHPACSPERIEAFCSSPDQAFASYKEELSLLGNWCRAFWQRERELEQLPHQLIHGDINASNMLMDDQGSLSAILDFEFVTSDLRVMEAAVCLSDILTDEASEAKQERVSAFLEGLRSQVDWSQQEWDALPLLVELRRVDVFVHFLGRYLEKIDSQEVLEGQIENANRVLLWLRDNPLVVDRRPE